MILAAPRADSLLHPIHANTGGPGSRTRTERVTSSVLGKDDGRVRCPRIIRLGLRFASDADPLDALDELLSQEGFGSPEYLRDQFEIPPIRLICRPTSDDSFRLDVQKADPRQVLEQALMLGLCTAHLYDSDRPVLWTLGSVTRAVELFDPAGFYA
jgi:hypothetical protein